MMETPKILIPKPVRPSDLEAPMPLHFLYIGQCFSGAAASMWALRFINGLGLGVWRLAVPQ